MEAEKRVSRLPPLGASIGGRYRLDREIARGGMGVVYEAFDEEEARAVALKLLHPELTKERDLRRRFRREAQLLTTLEHPAIVEVFGVGATDDELLFTVMELLEGETLAARLGRDSRLSLEALVPIVRDVAAGLRAAHEHGVIHGDLAPANVFILKRAGAPSTVKLLDFGLSKVFGLERLTVTGELIGTPAYMAPELLTGKGELDERIDTYSLGVMMYECLAGARPFSGSVPGKLMMDVVTGKPPPLGDRAPALPEAVVQLIEQAMSANRARRFSSATAIANAFATAVSA